MAILIVPKILREKLTDEGVESLIELFNKSEEKTKEDVIALSGEKFERRLSEEISGVRSDIAILEGKLEARISEVKVKLKEETSKLRVEMASFKAEIIKWMFLFWVGQLACIAGLIKWLR